MSLPGRHQAPAVALWLVGLAVVLGPVLAIPHPGVPEYHHTVTPAAEEDCTGGYRVRHFSELTPRGQRAFRTALADADDESVLYGEPAPRLQYPRDAEVLEVTHYVRYRGECYRLDATAPTTGLGPLFDWIAIVAGLAVGTGLLVAGHLSYVTDRPRVAAAPLAVLAALSVTLLVPPLPRWAIAAFAVVVTAGTWLALGRLGWTGPADRDGFRDSSIRVPAAVTLGSWALFAGAIYGDAVLAAVVVGLTALAAGWWVRRREA